MAIAPTKLQRRLSFLGAALLILASSCSDSSMDSRSPERPASGVDRSVSVICVRASTGEVVAGASIYAILMDSQSRPQKIAESDESGRASFLEPQAPVRRYEIRAPGLAYFQSNELEEFAHLLEGGQLTVVVVGAEGQPLSGHPVRVHINQTEQVPPPSLPNPRRVFTDSKGEVVVRGLSEEIWFVKTIEWKDFEASESASCQIVPNEPSPRVTLEVREPEGAWIRALVQLPKGVRASDVEMLDPYLNNWGAALLFGDNTIYLPMMPDEESTVLRFRLASDKTEFSPVEVTPSEELVSIALVFDGH